MEINDANSTTENIQKSQQHFADRINRAPKSSAERSREFRARKTLLKQQIKHQKQQQEPEENQITRPTQRNILEKRARSTAATRLWRARNNIHRETPKKEKYQKAIAESPKKQAKSTVQRMREYRERKKLAKRVILKQQRGGKQQNLDATDSAARDLYEKITNLSTNVSKNYNTFFILEEDVSFEIKTDIENCDKVEKFETLAPKIKEEPTLDIVDTAVVCDHTNIKFTDKGTGSTSSNNYNISFMNAEEDNFQINSDIENIVEADKLSNMNAPQAKIKVEPSLDIDDVAIVYDQTNADESAGSMPANNITRSKRENVDTNQRDEQAIKKLKIMPEQDEQQQWAAALKNDMLNTQFDIGDFDSDNGNAEHDDEDAQTASNGKSTTATNDAAEQRGELFLKLLTKHKLQSYAAKLKEMQISLEYLRFIQEVDIIDIFERDIGARIRFRGLLDDWRVSQMPQQFLSATTTRNTTTTTFAECSDESIECAPSVNCAQNISNGSEKTPNQIVNLLNEVASLKQNMIAGGKESEKRHRELVKQNEMLCQQLMKQAEMVKRIADQCFAAAVDFKIIPLRSIEQILEVEENIDNYAKGEFLEYLKLHLGRDEISKCVTLLFTEKLLLDINWDGKKQKTALNKFKFFNTYLFEAIKKKEMTFPEFEAEMKKGFKMAKNKVYKNAAKEREKLQTAVE